MASYEVTEDVVKAQDMFDDLGGGESKVAQRAEEMSPPSLSNTNAFNKVLHAYNKGKNRILFLFRR